MSSARRFSSWSGSPGGPLFSTRSFPTAFKTFSLGFFGFVRAQVRLHQMELRKSGLDEIPRAYAPEGIDADAPLLDRMLRIIDAARRARVPCPD